jgi:hypothetical protein
VIEAPQSDLSGSLNALQDPASAGFLLMEPFDSHGDTPACRWFDSVPGHHFQVIELHAVSLIAGARSIRRAADPRIFSPQSMAALCGGPPHRVLTMYGKAV